MRKTFLIVWALISISSNANVLKDTELNNNSTTLANTVLTDVAYGTSPRQKMDVYLPAGRNSSTRIVLLIPGGGWIAGDKSGFSGAASDFANANIVAFNMNYRYASIDDGITYVEMLDDIKSAIDFIVSKAGEYVFDPSQICLYGHSAGAHLALLYTYRNNDSRVNNVVSLAGPSNLRDAETLSRPTGIQTILYSVIGSMDVCAWGDASPITHVNAITTHLYHGTNDEIFPQKQSELLFAKIETLNPNNSLEIIQGGTHGFSTVDMTRTINETVVLINQ